MSLAAIHSTGSTPIETPARFIPSSRSDLFVDLLAEQFAVYSAAMPIESVTISSGKVDRQSPSANGRASIASIDKAATTDDALSSSSARIIVAASLNPAPSSIEVVNLKTSVVSSLILSDIIRDRWQAAVSAGESTVRMRFDTPEGSFDLRMNATAFGVQAVIVARMAQPGLDSLLPELIARLQDTGIAIRPMVATAVDSDELEVDHAKYPWPTPGGITRRKPRLDLDV